MSWLRRLNRIHAYEMDFPRLYADHVAWQAPVSCLLFVILLALSQVAFATDYQIEVIVFKRQMGQPKHQAASPMVVGQTSGRRT